MTEKEGADIRRMLATLQAIESQLANRQIPPAGLEDFKRGVDDIRLRVWAILAAANMEEPTRAMERFRIRRALDICGSLTEDLATGSLAGDHKELAVLEESLPRLRDALANARRRHGVTT